MNESLECVISEESRQKLLLAVAFPSPGSGGLVGAAQDAGLSVPDAVRLLNEPAFIAQVRQITFAEASMALHGQGVRDLIKIAAKGEDRDRLAAWRTIAQMTGDLKNKHQHDVRVTFEDLRGLRGDNSLAGLFDIRSAVIEAEVVDGS